MYKARIPLSGLDETATYPIVVGACVAIRKLLNISQSVPVKIGDGELLTLSKDVHNQIAHTPDILNEELHVEYSETSTEDFDVALTAWSGITKPIYLDTDIKSYMRPILNRRTLTLNVTYYGKSKSKVQAVANYLRFLNPSDARHIIDDIEYFYYAPDVFVMLMNTINNLKNTYTTPPLDLDAYIANTFTSETTVLNNEDGDINKTKLGFRNKQQFVLGTIDTDVAAIKPELDTGTNRWSLEVEYSMQYELPNHLYAEYPIAVYNQPMDTRFRIPSTRSYIQPGLRTLESDSLYSVISDVPEYLLIPTDSYYLHIPKEDTIVLPRPQGSYVRLFSALAAVSPPVPNTPSHLFYLDELPNITFKPDVLALIKLEASRMGDYGASMFYMDLYNHADMAYIPLTIKVVNMVVNGVMLERVAIESSTPLAINGCYRVGFNILPDLINLKQGGLDRLMANVATVDASTVLGFSVIDTVLGVFNLDSTMLTPGYNITDKTTSWDIALNIQNSTASKIFTKAVVMIATSALQPK